MAAWLDSLTLYSFLLNRGCSAHFSLFLRFGPRGAMQAVLDGRRHGFGSERADGPFMPPHIGGLGTDNLVHKIREVRHSGQQAVRTPKQPIRARPQMRCGAAAWIILDPVREPCPNGIPRHIPSRRPQMRPITAVAQERSLPWVAAEGDM